MDGKRRKQSIGFPVLLEMMFPRRLMEKIKEQLKIDGSKGVQAEHNYMRKGTLKRYESSKYRTEVLLHLSEDPNSQFGHMDFAFGKKVYSYGCYDASTHRFFNMMSDGVFVVSPREEYIRYCLTREKKVLIGYQLLLDAEQEKKIRDKLVAFEKELLIWRPNFYRRQHGENVDVSDAASLLQAATGAHFYKIKRRKFKTYSVIGSNCALMVDEFLSVLDVERITPMGIITPGSCYRYFENLLAKPNSIVAGRKVYVTEQKPLLTE